MAFVFFWRLLPLPLFFLAVAAAVCLGVCYRSLFLWMVGGWVCRFFFVDGVGGCVAAFLNEG